MWPRHRRINCLKSVSLHQDVIRLTMLVDRDSCKGVYRAMFIAGLRVLQLLHFPITALLPPKSDTLTILLLCKVFGHHGIAFVINWHFLRDYHYFIWLLSAVCFLIFDR